MLRVTYDPVLDLVTTPKPRHSSPTRDRSSPDQRRRRRGSSPISSCNGPRHPYPGAPFPPPSSEELQRWEELKRFQMRKVASWIFAQEITWHCVLKELRDAWGRKPGLGICSRQMSDLEWIVQVAQRKWATVSESLRSLKTNERPWAI